MIYDLCFYLHVRDDDESQGSHQKRLKSAPVQGHGERLAQGDHPKDDYPHKQAFIERSPLRDKDENYCGDAEDIESVSQWAETRRSRDL